MSEQIFLTRRDFIRSSAAALAGGAVLAGWFKFLSDCYSRRSVPAAVAELTQGSSSRPVSMKSK